MASLNALSCCISFEVWFCIILFKWEEKIQREVSLTCRAYKQHEEINQDSKTQVSCRTVLIF